MYHDVWQCDVYECIFVWENKSLTNAGKFVESWADVEESSSFPLGMMNDADCTNKPVGEDDSVGDKPGEEITLRGITLGEEMLRWDFNDNSAGDPVDNPVGDFDDELRWG